MYGLKGSWALLAGDYCEAWEIPNRLMLGFKFRTILNARAIFASAKSESA